MIAILGIDYSEPIEPIEPESEASPSLDYRGVTLKMMPDGAQEKFMSGDATVDYLTAGYVAHYRLGKGAPVMCSSSVDHFVMDGGTLEDEDPSKEQIQKAVAAGRAYLTSRGEGPKPEVSSK